MSMVSEFEKANTLGTNLARNELYILFDLMHSDRDNICFQKSELKILEAGVPQETLLGLHYVNVSAREVKLT